MTRIAPLRIASQPNFPSFGRPAGVIAMWAALTVVSALVLTGCGGEPKPMSLPPEPLQPVKGQVSLPDGKPLTDGTITFSPVKPSSRAATGKVGSDGSYTLKSGDLGEGAAEGDYLVSVESPLTAPGPKPGVTQPLVPSVFSPDSTPLKVTVKAGPNEIPIKLVPPPKVAPRPAGRVED